MIDLILIGGVWGIGAPAAVWATVHLMRLLDRYCPMPEEFE